MASLSDFEKLLPSLSPGEKAQILKWVVQELGGGFSGIDSRPEVCGGTAQISGPKPTSEDQSAAAVRRPGDYAAM